MLSPLLKRLEGETVVWVVVIAYAGSNFLPEQYI